MTTPKPNVISVALIEDNRLVSDGISLLLNQVPDIRVVFRRVVTGGSRGDASLLKGANPHVVLLDLGLRNRDSLRVIEEIKQELPASKVIVMDLFPIDDELVELVKAGVSGLLMKNATLDDFVTTIRSVAEGAHVLPPQVTTTLFSQIANAATRRRRPAALDTVRMTRREREVVNLIAEGLANKEIAVRLNIATYTVKSHVRNIMEKLMLHSRLQIAAYVHRGGGEDHPVAATLSLRRAH
jgi:DNA-binding NarL/FixJ family response regulator